MKVIYDITTWSGACSSKRGLKCVINTLQSENHTIIGPCVIGASLSKPHLALLLDEMCVCPFVHLSICTVYVVGAR